VEELDKGYSSLASTVDYSCSISHPIEYSRKVFRGSLSCLKRLQGHNSMVPQLDLCYLPDVKTSTVPI
jgi:hypothetical protein